MAHQQPALTTVNWNQAPVNNPESTLIGSMYQSVGAKADMVVTDAVVVVLRRVQPRATARPSATSSSASTTATSRPSPARPTPTCWPTRPCPDRPTGPTSPTTPRRGNGGGVLASGSASFVSLLGTTGVIPPNVIVRAIPGVTDVIRRAMENVYGRFGLGPATSYGPSSGNWADVYTGAAASAGTAAGTPSA